MSSPRRVVRKGIAVAKELRPSVVTLDILMHGMDGWSVLQAFKADPELADIPIIMLSVLDEKQKGLALGASDYLIKPIDRPDWHRLSNASNPVIPQGESLWPRMTRRRATCCVVFWWERVGMFSRRRTAAKPYPSWRPTPSISSFSIY